jgi:hypothetical protein
MGGSGNNERPLNETSIHMQTFLHSMYFLKNLYLPKYDLMKNSDNMAMKIRFWATSSKKLI